MKKTIVYITSLVLLISCSMENTSVELGEELKKELKKNTEEVKEDATIKKPVIELSLKDIETDCQIEAFESIDGKNYLRLKEMSFEEVPNTVDPENPIAKIIVGEEELTFVFAHEKYFNCAHTKEVSIDELKKLWESNVDMPIRVKTQNGEVVEMYKDECSG